MDASRFKILGKPWHFISKLKILIAMYTKVFIKSVENVYYQKLRLDFKIV